MKSSPVFLPLLKKKALLIGSIVFFTCITVLLFRNLSVLPIRDFDEARNAINALEMFHDHNVIVTHFEGQPDLWNTKPPLMIWCQAICIQLFGFGEFAIRFPSAIAGLFTCIFLFLFCSKYLKNKMLGVFSVLVLFSINGYVNFHGTRTGDYDALLTFFTTVSCLCFFIYTFNDKSKYLYAFFVSMGLAVLTKGISGLLFLPAVFVFSLLRNKFIGLLKSKDFYLGTFVFLSMTGGYYIVREILNPGYLNAVIENELGGRFLNTIENHSGNFLYYFENFIDRRLAFWYFLIPCGMFLGFINKDFHLKNLSVFLSLLTISFLLIISFSQTKCYWYDIPLFPFFALLVAIALTCIYNAYQKFNLVKNRLLIHIAGVLTILILFYEPFRTTFKRISKTDEETWEVKKYEISHFLQAACKGKYNLENFKLVHHGYPTHLLFYIYLLNEKGIHFSFANENTLQSGDKIILYQQEILEALESRFSILTLFTESNVMAIQLQPKAEQQSRY